MACSVSFECVRNDSLNSETDLFISKVADEKNLLYPWSGAGAPDPLLVYESIDTAQKQNRKFVPPPPPFPHHLCTLRPPATPGSSGASQPPPWGSTQSDGNQQKDNALSAPGICSYLENGALQTDIEQGSIVEKQAHARSELPLIRQSWKLLADAEEHGVPTSPVSPPGMTSALDPTRQFAEVETTATPSPPPPQPHPFPPPASPPSPPISTSSSWPSSRPPSPPPSHPPPPPPPLQIDELKPVQLQEAVIRAHPLPPVLGDSAEKGVLSAEDSSSPSSTHQALPIRTNGSTGNLEHVAKAAFSAQGEIDDNEDENTAREGNASVVLSSTLKSQKAFVNQVTNDSIAKKVQDRHLNEAQPLLSSQGEQNRLFEEEAVHGSKNNLPLAPEAANCQRCNDLQRKVCTLQNTVLTLGESCAMATEEAETLRIDLEKDRDECVRDDRLRAENERLLDVVFTLKEQLDREPLTPEVINELQNMKERVALLTIEKDELVSCVRDLQNAERLRAASGRKSGPAARLRK